MAETNNGPSNAINNSIADYIETMSLDTEGTLKSIDLTLKAIARQDGLMISQSSLKDLAEIERQQGTRSQREERTRQARDARRQGAAGSGQYSRSGNSEDAYSRRKSSNKSFFDDATEQFEKEFKKALFGSADPMGDMMKKTVKGLADKLGVDVDNLGKEIGKNLGKMASNSLKNSKFGQQLAKEWQGFGQKFTSAASRTVDGFGDALKRASSDPNASFRSVFRDGMSSARDNMKRNFQSAADNMGDFGDIPNQGAANAGSAGFQNVLNQEVENIAKNFGGEDVAQIGTAAEGVSDALALTEEGIVEVGAEMSATSAATAEAGSSLALLGGEAGAAGSAFPYATAAIIAASIAIDNLSEVFGPAVNGIKKFVSALSAAGNRYKEQNRKNLELWKTRVKEDMKSITKAAFDVIEDAAKTAMDAWDQVAGTVAATQGYTKEGVQQLWGNFSDTLRKEGLTSYVSSADIMKNLESVLKQGLSGEVAEAFAYEATKLNAAVPTTDFFQYAQTYASIVANQAKNGEALSSAIDVANQQLEQFASNLLYADDQLAGGMAMDISNGAKLFDEATKIVLTARNSEGRATLTNVDKVSGVLTSVSAIVSAIAPDVADTLVSAVVDAALGGNSSNLTALRSMAGVGASNTAFLKALAENPQKVFSDLFAGLANLQGMSSANYMEVADALADVFGLTRDAFARVDFKYLSDAVADMQTVNKSLDKRFDMLKSGETTSTAEQLRMQKINEYMIEEGLAYVLDSEVGRAVQEHMWQEQMQQEMFENTFAVNLQGSALEMLEGIWDTIQSILDFLNPFSWIGKIVNIALTAEEASAQSEDLKAALQKTAVGTNAAAWTRLTTGNTDLRNAGLLSLNGINNKNYFEMLLGADSKVAQNLREQEGWKDFTLRNSVTTGMTAEQIANAQKADAVYNKMIGFYNKFGQAVSKTFAKQAAQSRGNVTSAYTRQMYQGKPSSADNEWYSGGVQDWGEQWTDKQSTFGKFAIGTDKNGKPIYYEDKGFTSSSKATTVEAKQKEAAKYANDLSSALQQSMTSYLSTVGEFGKEYKKIAKEVRGNEIIMSGAKMQFLDTSGELHEYASKGLTIQNESQNIGYTKGGEDKYKINKLIEAGVIDAGKILRSYDINKYIDDKTKEVKNRTYLTADDYLDILDKYEANKKEDATFSGWVSKTFKVTDETTKELRDANLNDLASIAETYGTSVSAIQAQYNQLQAQQESKKEKARAMHEEQFWSDMQNFATLLFPEYLNEWKKYYVMHTAYTNATLGAYQEAMKVNDEAAGQETDAVLSLAQELTNNDRWKNFAADIANPTVQTNMLLAKILVIVEAIMQQNNETSIVSVPTALSSLGLGITTSTAGDGAKNTKDKKKK